MRRCRLCGTDVARAGSDRGRHEVREVGHRAERCWNDEEAIRRRLCDTDATRAGSDRGRHEDREVGHRAERYSSAEVTIRRRLCGTDATRAGSDLWRREVHVTSRPLGGRASRRPHPLERVERQNCWCDARRAFVRRRDADLHAVRVLRCCHFATTVTGAYFEPLSAGRPDVLMMILGSPRLEVRWKVCGPKEFCEKVDSMRARSSLSGEERLESQRFTTQRERSWDERSSTNGAINETSNLTPLTINVVIANDLTAPGCKNHHVDFCRATC